MSGPALLWLGRDLRLADNPALLHAAATGRPVLALYILDDRDRTLGRGARWWLRESLAAFAASSGMPLVLRRGDPARILPEMAGAIGAGTVCWNRRPDPRLAASDEGIAADLRGRGVEVFTGSASLLVEPGSLRTGAGTPYQVFGQFWRACRAADPARPKRTPETIAGFPEPPEGLSLDELFPLEWAPQGDWQPGEAAAREQLSQFLDRGLGDYPIQRDIPAAPGTSLASPRLAWGEVSPRQIWHATLARIADGRAGSAGAEAFLRQIGWREFSYGLLAAHPDFATRPMRDPFERFPWRRSTEDFAAWREGRTGYPLIDAGMRALAATGWLHNRLRMVVGSFLVKHLLLPWQDGEAWFWETLVDADPANNPAGWQWATGCGIDSAPYFRIFNPMLQGERFDPRGDYVRRWVPELAGLPAEHIHRPWLAPAEVRSKAYPPPIVDHAAARARALAALATLREKPSPSQR